MYIYIDKLPPTFSLGYALSDDVRCVAYLENTSVKIATT